MVELKVVGRTEGCKVEVSFLRNGDERATLKVDDAGFGISVTLFLSRWGEAPEDIIGALEEGKEELEAIKRWIKEYRDVLISLRNALHIIRTVDLGGERA